MSRLTNGWAIGLLICLTPTLRAQAKPETIPQLIERLRDDKPGEDKLGAVARLAMLGEPAVPALRALLKKGKETEQLLALTVLGLIGPPAQAAAEDIIPLCKADNEADAERALLAACTLISIRPKDCQPALELLRKALTGELEASVVAAVWLADISPNDAAQVAKVLVEVQDRRRGGFLDFTPLFQATAVWGMGGIPTGAEKAVPALRPALKHADVCVRVCAARALARCSPKDRKDAVAVLVAAAKSADDDQCAILKTMREVIEALPTLPGRKGREQDPILLCKLLKQRKPFNQFPGPQLLDEAIASVQAVSEGKPVPKSPKLMRRLALAALEEIDPEAARAVGKP